MVAALIPRLTKTRITHKFRICFAAYQRNERERLEEAAKERFGTDWADKVIRGTSDIPLRSSESDAQAFKGHRAG
jgi:hypothetical protein